MSRPKGPKGPALEALLGTRGFGHLYQPTYTAKTLCPGPIKPMEDGWTCTHCAASGKGDGIHRETRRSSLWWFKWSHNGISSKKSTKTSDRQVAEEYRRNQLMEMWGGRLPWEPQKEATLAEVLERGITKAKTKGRASIDTMEESVGRLLGRARQRAKKEARGEKITPDDKERWARVEAVKLATGASTPASAITEDAIDRYVLARREQGYAPATINRDLAMLRRAFNVALKTLDAQRRPLVNRVPTIELLQEDNVRQGFPTEEEYRAIRSNLPWCLPQLVDFYRVTGYRRSEPLKITWAQVDREAGCIRIDPGDTKSGKWRADWPFAKHPLLKAVVEAQWKLKLEVEREQSVIITHLFFWEDGRQIKTFRNSWANARNAAGLPHRLVHDFRRMATRDMVRARPKGGNKTVMRMIGAKTQSILDRYNINTGEDEAEAAEALAEYHKQQAPQPQLVLPFAKKEKAGS